jgi:sugar lactone lactonase YvrE
VVVTDPSSVWEASESDTVLRYVANSRWGQEGLPTGGWFGRVSAVVQVPDGRVVVFHRGPAAPDVVIFDPDERALTGWSLDFGVEHGMRLAPDGHLWFTDAGRHTVVKATVDGEVLLKLGVEDQPGTDERTFDAPTDLAFATDGSVYITDGYGNSRVVHLAPDGSFIRSWGRRGSAPGEFDTPHSVAIAADGRVLVSDRHNHRVQIFDPDGMYITEWTHLGATQCLTFGPDGDLWAMTHRSIDEILSFDSIAGRLIKLDADTGEPQGWLPTPGHMMTESSTGDLWVASLSGTVIRFRPGWVVQGPQGPRETF